MDLQKYDLLVNPTYEAAVTASSFQREFLNRLYSQSFDDNELSPIVNAMGIILDQCIDLLNRAEALRTEVVLDADTDNEVEFAKVVTAKIDYSKLLMKTSGEVAHFLEIAINSEVYVEGSDAVLSSIQTMLENYHTMEIEFGTWREANGK